MRSLLFGSQTTGPIGDVGLLLLRVFAGLALAFQHGINKVPPAPGFIDRVRGFGFPFPEFFAHMAGFAEFVGGIMLAAGLFTRPFAALIVVNMIVVVVFGHAGDPFGRRELPLLFLFVALMYTFVGGGRYSLDTLLRRGAERRRAGAAIGALMSPVTADRDSRRRGRPAG